MHARLPSNRLEQNASMLASQPKAPHRPPPARLKPAPIGLDDSSGHGDRRLLPEGQSLCLMLHQQPHKDLTFRTQWFKGGRDQIRGHRQLQILRAHRQSAPQLLVHARLIDKRRAHAFVNRHAGVFKAIDLHQRSIFHARCPFFYRSSWSSKFRQRTHREGRSSQWNCRRQDVANIS